jgi:N,N'-diacetyllegionaminate synthase
MELKIKIGSKSVGEGSPVFIIAEAGVNHNGDLKTAMKLIDTAKECGADAVKFQTFKAEKLVTKDADMCSYQKENTGVSESQFSMLKRLELSEDDHIKLYEHAKKVGIIFLSTPFDEDSIDFLDNLGVTAFKVGSTDANNIPYLIKMAKKSKPMIISFGMSDDAEVSRSIEVVKKHNNQIVLLHCTTAYPASFDEVNLKAMESLKEKNQVLVGYSDHTEGFEVSIAAATLGTSVIEKHFTLSKDMEGPDHKASIEPDELSMMVRSIRNVEKALGQNKKIITKTSSSFVKYVKKSIVAKKDIEKEEYEKAAVLRDKIKNMNH